MEKVRLIGIAIFLMSATYYPERGPRRLPSPRTPKHCPICGQRIDRVDAQGMHVGGWRARTIYIEHCEADHADYGDWLNKWRGINGFFFLPAFIILVVGYVLRSIPVLIAAVAAFAVLYSIWSIHSRRVVGAYREQWQEQHGAPVIED